MTDHHEDPAITIGPNVISLRMVRPLNDRRVQHLFKELFMQCNIRRFNLEVFNLSPRQHCVHGLRWAT